MSQRRDSRGRFARGGGFGGLFSGLASKDSVVDAQETDSMSHRALGPQFSPSEVGALRAGDFSGSIGDHAARTRFKRASLNGDTVRTSHRIEGGPLAHLDQFTEKVRADGAITTPVEVVAHDDYYSLHDGHHRALAAHAAGLPLPYKVVKDLR